MITIKSNPILTYQTRRKREFYQLCQKSSQKVGGILPKNEISDIMLLEEKLVRLLSQTMEGYRKLIVSCVEEVIEDTLKHYNKYHEELTGVLIDKNTLIELKLELLKQFAYHPFYGKTFDGRIGDIQKKLANNLVKTLQSYNDPAEMEDELKDYFYTFNQVSGGSLRGRGETLLISEENRFYHNAAVSYFRKVGVTFVRFCLTPNYNEEGDLVTIAEQKNSEVQKKFPGFNATGLYRLEELPDYPRPRAVYYLEPVYHIGYLKF